MKIALLTRLLIDPFQFPSSFLSRPPTYVLEDHFQSELDLP